MPIVSNERFYQLDKMLGTFLVHKVIRLLKSRIYDLSELISFLEKNQRFEHANEEEKQFLGYRLVDDIKFPKEIELDEDYKIIANNIITIEYFWRKQIKRNVMRFNKDGFQSENEEIFDTNHRDYIFIIYPDLLIFKGSEESYDIVWESFFRILKRKFSDFEPMSFSKYFLTYLFYKITLRQTNIDKDFYINYIQDVFFHGRDKFVEEFIDIRNLYIPSKSLILYHCLVEGKKLKRTSIDFKLKEKYITAELRDSGALLVRQNRGSFIEWSYNERAFHGCYFIYRLISFLNILQNQDKRNIQDLTEDLINYLGYKRDK